MILPRSTRRKLLELRDELLAGADAAERAAERAAAGEDEPEEEELEERER